MITQTTSRYLTTLRVPLLALAALTMSMSVVACSDSDTPNPAPAASSTDPISQNIGSSSSPAPEDIEDPLQAAVAAYERFRSVTAEAASIPDPGYAQLEQVAADDALATTRSSLQQLLDAGQRTEGAPETSAKVKEYAIEGDPVQVVVLDCSDTTSWPVVEADTGEPVKGEEYGRRSIDAMVELREDGWRVTELLVRSIGSCLPGRFVPH
ncbi:hypothetical protein [Glycomyces tenuis]|uniref:hypothetical protein n=1 Tax=Glycomyces tenuis TaxID=58116 RepID=UPI00047AF5F1|nr:hypothetical protein [Glycomyces tenuis]